MALLTPFLSLNYPADKSLVWLKERLTTANLRVMQTFDLNTARHSVEDCPCPHHGTDQCDCQMVVLLVYTDAAEPVTLVLHGNDGQTRISLVENPNQQSSQETVRVIQRAFEVQGPVGI